MTKQQIRAHNARMKMMNSLAGSGILFFWWRKKNRAWNWRVFGR